MSKDKGRTLQDIFLEGIKEDRAPVTLFLVNGVKLQGVITYFDHLSILLSREGHSQLVYKHAISTVMPAHPVQIFDKLSDTFTECLDTEIS